MSIAVVLIRGRITFTQEVCDTLDMLGLNRKHSCSVVKDDAHTRGMLQKVKDICTFGPVSEEMVKELQAKSSSKDKVRVRLHPPRGGYERKGIKVPFAKGGATGNRGDKMEALLKRMMV